MRKRITSVFLATLLGMVGFSAWAQESDRLSFGVISDVHFENNVGEGAMVKVPRALKNLTSHKALDAMFISQDYGITWRTSTELHMPIQLEGIEGCITSTVDKNNFIWIITNAQVWRGRLNRLGFAQQ